MRNEPLAATPGFTGGHGPPREAIVVPGASDAVALDPIVREASIYRPSPVEMAAAWKPQNGFHTTLEISHRPRDSHISTGAHRCGDDDKHGDDESPR